MSDIEWSPWFKGFPDEASHYGAYIQSDGSGKYRIPMSVYKRITGMPEWSEAPEWAMYLCQDADGQWKFTDTIPRHEHSHGGSFWVGETHKQAGLPGTVLGDWRETLQERPAEGPVSEARAFIRDQCLEIMPDGRTVRVTKEEIDSVLGTGSDTIDDSNHQPPRSKYHREIAPGVWVDVYDVLKAWSVTNPALQHLIKKALAPGERGHKTLEQDMNDIVASAMRARELV